MPRFRSLFLALGAVAAMLSLAAHAQDSSQSKAPIVVMMGDTERLLATEDIRLLKGRYFTATDGKDWKALRDVFASDAKISVGMKRADGSNAGTVDEFIQSVMAATAQLGTRHHGHNLRVTFTSATEADGVWDSEAWLWTLPGAKMREPTQHHLGQYIEHYTKTKDGWRIASMQATAVHSSQGK